jgi:hypothetical protein
MDFGRFRRCTGERNMWLVGPVLLAGTILFGINTFSGYVSNSLLRERAIVNVLPAFETRKEQMTDMVNFLAPTKSGEDSSEDPVEACIGTINETARTAGVQIVALQNLSQERGRRSRKKEQQAESVLLATQAEGQLDHVISFLFALQERHRLVTFDSFTMNMRPTDGLPRYDVELMIEFHRIPNASKQ